jgi:hypothetical protein
MTTELLDAVIARLPALRDQGVTHFSVAKDGAISFIMAPKLPEAEPTKEPQERQEPWDPAALGLDVSTPRPRSFRERQASRAPQVK